MNDLSDCILIWGKNHFLCHSQILATRSATFAHLISIALNNRDVITSSDEKQKLTIAVPSTCPDFVKNTPHKECFLRHLYSLDPFQIADLAEAFELIRLADFFGAAVLNVDIEAVLCNLTIGYLQRPQEHSVDDLCTIFEFAVSNVRLTRLTALLLPWVLQRLNKGRLGEFGDPSSWEAVQLRLTRFRNAMDPEIKVIAMDQQWWSCSLPSRCPVCHCRSGDLALVIHPSYIEHLQMSIAQLGFTQYLSYAESSYDSTGAPRLPETYVAVAAHMAHVLKDRNWGSTPARSRCGTLRPQ